MNKVLTTIKNKFFGSDNTVNILSQALAFETDIIIITDHTGTVLALNPIAKQTFLHLEAGGKIQLILRSPLISEAFDELNQTDKNSITLDFTVHQPIEKNFLFVLIKTSNGFYIRIHDNTAQKKALKMHGDFVANVSHEMRTPLASILGFIETLQGPAKDDPDAHQQFLGIMYAQAKRMKSLVDALLSLSRYELNRHVLPTDHIDLTKLLNEVMLACQPIAHSKDIAIQYNLDNNLRLVLGNKDELFQVFQNLIENAIKYSNNNTMIKIELLDRDNHQVVSVTDQGRGIDQQHLPRLTERFYRVDDARNRKEGGAGLGLSIVTTILARHNAKMEIESERDKGSIFRVVFDKIQP